MLMGITDVAPDIAVSLPSESWEFIHMIKITYWEFRLLKTSFLSSSLNGLNLEKYDIKKIS